MQSLTKQALCTGFFSLAVVSFVTSSSALTVEEVPNPRQENAGWVTDMTNILNDSSEAELNRLLSELEAKKGIEVAVVTVPDTTAANSSKEFTTALFKYWGIGKAEQDNGMLFLISQRDRRVEIETGYRIEKTLPDTEVSRVIEQQIMPQFKEGDFDSGTLAGTQALVKALESTPQSFEKPRTAHTLIGFGLGVLLGCAGLVGLLMMFRYLSEGSGGSGNSSGSGGKNDWAVYSGSDYEAGCGGAGGSSSCGGAGGDF